MVMLNEEYGRSVHARIYAIAEAIAKHELSCLEGAVQLSALQDAAAGTDGDTDLVVFASIVSETDSLPTGPERQFWSPSALAKQDIRIAEAERRAREISRDALQSLLSRFQA